MIPPFGVFSPRGEPVRRAGVRVGDAVVDLSELDPVFRRSSLNGFLALGRARWLDWFERIAAYLPGRPELPLDAVDLHLPFEVADYTDFYSSEHHALAAGAILRPDRPGLPPNWKHLPIGYHGRSATVVVSGTPIARPSGQLGPGVYGPSRRLDIEAEVGFVVGVPGERIATGRFADHVFGVVLVNDWSARDLQAFEYQPLGPFLGKSFATSISPWVVPLAALAGLPSPPQEAVHPYLRPAGDAYDIELRVLINGTTVSEPPFRSMYWTAAQQLAHLTGNGARVRTGDLYASGTVSGPRPDQAGSLLELTRDGAEPLTLADGSPRGYLLDGDTVTITATANGGTITLGEVSGTVTA